MMNKDQIREWLDSGTISQEQADKMLADVIEHKKERGSNKIIVAISTIGSILLGVGAIMFIASNWAAMPNIVKVLILLGSTFAAYFFGYLLKYKWANLPKVGGSLIFLGALLFGATIFLLAQIYHVNANAHVLVLIWLVGILPLVYALRSAVIASLSAVLFYVWIALLVFAGSSFGFFNFATDLLSLPTLYIVTSILLFNIGAFHYLSERLKKVARVFRIAGLKIALLALFLHTFRIFSGEYRDFSLFNEIEHSGSFTLWFTLVAIAAAITSIVALFMNPAKSKVKNLENGISLGITALATLFFFAPISGNVYTIFFNLVFIAVIAVLIYLGYRNEDLTLVNMGMFWVSALIIIRYFDFFWDLLPRSLFFLVGGVVLVGGAIALERKRRQLKVRFKHE